MGPEGAIFFGDPVQRFRLVNELHPEFFGIQPTVLIAPGGRITGRIDRLQILGHHIKNLARRRICDVHTDNRRSHGFVHTQPQLPWLAQIDRRSPLRPNPPGQTRFFPGCQAVDLLFQWPQSDQTVSIGFMKANRQVLQFLVRYVHDFRHEGMNFALYRLSRRRMPDDLGSFHLGTGRLQLGDQRVLPIAGFNANPEASNRIGGKRWNLSREQFHRTKMLLHPVSLIIVRQSPVDPNGAPVSWRQSTGKHVADSRQCPAIPANGGDMQTARPLRGQELKPVIQFVVRTVHVQKIGQPRLRSGRQFQRLRRQQARAGHYPEKIFRPFGNQVFLQSPVLGGLRRQLLQSGNRPFRYRSRPVPAARQRGEILRKQTAATQQKQATEQNNQRFISFLHHKQPDQRSCGTRLGFANRPPGPLPNNSRPAIPSKSDCPSAPSSISQRPPRPYS